MPKTPGFRIKNCTQWPITVSLDQVGPLYYGLVQPGEIFQRDTGAVWFTIKASISADNKCHITDWDCVMPVASIVGSVLLGAITGGVSAFPTIGASVGAAALVHGGAVSLSSIVVPAVLAGGLTSGTAVGILGKIFSEGCDAKKMGCYAGPPWPLQKSMPEYSVVGGPIAYSLNGQLALEPGAKLQIVNGLQPTPPVPSARTEAPAQLQADWRWCHKCQGLFYSGGKTSAGSCSAGGQHEHKGSGNYALSQNPSVGQLDWRWCHKCESLFHAGGQTSAGSCSAGGQHEHKGSGNYALSQDSSVGQSDWRWCHKCQGLFYSGGQTSAGSCSAGGQHEQKNSGNYVLSQDKIHP